MSAPTVIDAATRSDLEAGFERIRRCSCCRSPLRGLVYRRAYPSADGTVFLLAVLCSECDPAIEVGSPAEAELRRRVEREAMQEMAS